MNRRSFLKFLLAIPGLAWLGSRKQSTDDYLTDGNDWYVDGNTGSDIFGNGTYRRPFKTISKAIEVARGGETICASVINEGITISKSDLTIIRI